MIPDNHQTNTQIPSPYAAKANFDVNERKLHSKGTDGLRYQVTNLLILIGIIALIYGVTRLL
ncbi:hypothetical protein [Paenibacillus pini]|uniref:hypothetical protein n=1 Tax=Paenibacillus pini TaxID=669461 RepID=UPI00055CA666|nr:hypothetical protein [Paenibacillus pini]